MWGWKPMVEGLGYKWQRGNKAGMILARQESRRSRGKTERGGMKLLEALQLFVKDRLNVTAVHLLVFSRFSNASDAQPDRMSASTSAGHLQASSTMPASLSQQIPPPPSPSPCASAQFWTPDSTSSRWPMHFGRRIITFGTANFLRKFILYL